MDPADSAGPTRRMQPGRHTARPRPALGEWSSFYRFVRPVESSVGWANSDLHGSDNNILKTMLESLDRIGVGQKFKRGPVNMFFSKSALPKDCSFKKSCLT
jgi:hypothetical protein